MQKCASTSLRFAASNFASAVARLSRTIGASRAVAARAAAFSASSAATASAANLVDLEKCGRSLLFSLFAVPLRNGAREKLKKEYARNILVARIGVDTAENEPSEVWPA